MDQNHPNVQRFSGFAEVYDRYRPSLWLTRRARLGVSLLTPEG